MLFQSKYNVSFGEGRWIQFIFKSQIELRVFLVLLYYVEVFKI